MILRWCSQSQHDDRILDQWDSRVRDGTGYEEGADRVGDVPSIVCHKIGAYDHPNTAQSVGQDVEVDT